MAVRARCGSPVDKERARTLAISLLQVSRSESYSGSVKRRPLENLKSHKIQARCSSSRRLVGTKVHRASSHFELRKNQSRLLISSADASGRSARLFDDVVIATAAMREASREGRSPP